MAPADDHRKQAIRFILLLGVVSLLADITYEGARGITLNPAVEPARNRACPVVATNRSSGSYHQTGDLRSS
jgi:hypothetical protein